MCLSHWQPQPTTAALGWFRLSHYALAGSNTAGLGLSLLPPETRSLWKRSQQWQSSISLLPQLHLHGIKHLPRHCNESLAKNKEIKKTAPALTLFTVTGLFSEGLKGVSNSYQPAFQQQWLKRVLRSTLLNKMSVNTWGASAEPFPLCANILKFS